MKTKIRRSLIGLTVLVAAGGATLLISGVLADVKNQSVSSGKKTSNKSTAPENTSTASKNTSTRKATQAPKAPAPDFRSYRINSYRIWTCANPQPYFVPAPIAAACAPFTMHPPKNSRSPHSQFNPHQGKYIRVFV